MKQGNVNKFATRDLINKSPQINGSTRPLADTIFIMERFSFEIEAKAGEPRVLIGSANLAMTLDFDLSGEPDSVHS